MLRKKLNDPKLQYLMVLFSNAVVILLGFVINILITHTMETKNFGFYRAFVNSITMLATLTSFGFSLTLSKDFAVCSEKTEKRSLTGAAILVNLAISAIVFCILFFGGQITKLFGLVVPDYLLYASAFVWTFLFNRFYLFRFQGENNMLAYSVLTALPQLILFVVYVICCFFDCSVSSFVAVLAYLLSYLLVITIFVLIELPSFRGIEASLKSLLKRNRNYGFQLYLGSIFSVASAQILNLLVASLAGLEEYALFTMGMSVATPISQIPSVMGTISFKKNVSEKKLSGKQIALTFGMTAAAFVCYALFLKFLFPLLLGEEYRACVSYGIIMMFYYVFIGLGDFFNRFIMAKGQGKMIRNSSFVVGATLIVGAALLIPFIKIKGVIVAEILSGAVYLLAMVLKYRKTIKLESKEGE